MFQDNQHCWISCVYSMLKELDMLKVFRSPEARGYKDIFKIKQLLRDNYANIWKREINKEKIIH